ncbi:MAG: hypothetical protein BWY88_00009 [Synergistetes bacterium ADurb.Bin520]|nr:MAG: hypothetical protein BWY88_00009 [Synergistetes bacterium ADurb.Bin520]
MRARQVEGRTRGVSPGSTSTARVLGGRAESPTRRELNMSPSGSGLATVGHPSCRASPSTASRWCPVTTTTGCAPPSRSRVTAWASTVEPPRGRSILPHPIREERPAARTRAAGVLWGMVLGDAVWVGRGE